MAFQWELGGSPPNPFPQDRRAPSSFIYREFQVRPRGVGRGFRSTASLLTSIFLAAFSFAPRAALGQTPGEPRFGDSTWVAPRLPGNELPTDAGPRVAEPDHERTWETVLRTPFRVVFLPVRLVARGTEEMVGIAAPRVLPYLPGPQQTHGPKQGVHIAPAFSYFGAAGPGIGPSITAPEILGPGSALKLGGTWSTLDTREFRVRGYTGEGVSPVGLNALGRYDYRPNQRFYGIGNDSRLGDQSVYLNDEKRGEVSAWLGTKPYRRVRALVAVSGVSIGGGYHTQGKPLAENVFSPAEVPFLTEGSTVVGYGAAGEFAVINSMEIPARGFDLLADARHYQSTDGANLDYQFWRTEGRGYLPVFSLRRVIAARVVYEGVNPAEGSAPIPFYRLPEATGPDRFSGYASHRFRDDQLMLAHGEYRWIIWGKNVWALLLADAGEVKPTFSDFSWADRHSSAGLGFLATISPTTLGRLEFAKGNEGWQVNLDFKAGF